jgi:hypothetical protein
MPDIIADGQQTSIQLVKQSSIGSGAATMATAAWLWLDPKMGGKLCEGSKVETRSRQITSDVATSSPERYDSMLILMAACRSQSSEVKSSFRRHEKCEKSRDCKGETKHRL